MSEPKKKVKSEETVLLHEVPVYDVASGSLLGTVYVDKILYREIAAGREVVLRQPEYKDPNQEELPLPNNSH